MARLTRTQKFAGLRESLTNDRETSTSTEELNKYEDKLKNIENFLDNKEEIKKEVPSYNEAKDTFVAFDEKADQPFFDFLANLDTDTLDKRVTNSIDETVTKYESSQQVVEKEEEPVAPNLDNIMSFQVDEKEEPVADFFDEIKPEVVDNDVSFTMVEEKEAPVVEEVVEEPVKNNEIENSFQFIDEALKEAQAYNQNDGRMTFDELSTSMISQIVHPENEPVITDDEFSNTVSLEIDKVLSELRQASDAEEVVEEPVVELAPKIEQAPVIEEVSIVKQTVAQLEEEVVIPPVVEQPISEEINLSKTVELPKTVVESEFEHPVAAVAKEDDGIEIMSMEETIKQEILSDTIPFVVDDALKQDSEEEIEEEDDSAPNKVLNVILVVLIVILLAILGVIVYYILYAKGIIG